MELEVGDVKTKPLSEMTGRSAHLFEVHGEADHAMGGDGVGAPRGRVMLPQNVWQGRMRLVEMEASRPVLEGGYGDLGRRHKGQ